MAQSVVYRGMRWKWLVEFWPNEVGGWWLTKNHPDFDKSRKLLLDPVFVRVRLIIPDRKHPKYQSVELQFRRVYWQPILPVQSPCDMKPFQEILSKIELVDIYQTIDNEFQAHAIYFARRPTVFPKPILCEVKPKKDSLEPKTTHLTTKSSPGIHTPSAVSSVVPGLVLNLPLFQWFLARILEYLVRHIVQRNERLQVWPQADHILLHIAKIIGKICHVHFYRNLPDKDESNHTDYHPAACPELVCRSKLSESIVELPQLQPFLEFRDVTALQPQMVIRLRRRQLQHVTSSPSDLLASSSKYYTLQVEVIHELLHHIVQSRKIILFWVASMKPVTYSFVISPQEVVSHEIFWLDTLCDSDQISFQEWRLNFEKTISHITAQ